MISKNIKTEKIVNKKFSIKKLFYAILCGGACGIIAFIATYYFSAIILILLKEYDFIQLGIKDFYFGLINLSFSFISLILFTFLGYKSGMKRRIELNKESR